MYMIIWFSVVAFVKKADFDDLWHNRMISKFKQHIIYLLSYTRMCTSGSKAMEILCHFFNNPTDLHFIN